MVFQSLIQIHSDVSFMLFFTQIKETLIPLPNLQRLIFGATCAWWWSEWNWVNEKFSDGKFWKPEEDFGCGFSSLFFKSSGGKEVLRLRFLHSFKVHRPLRFSTSRLNITEAWFLSHNSQILYNFRVKMEGNFGGTAICCLWWWRKPPMNFSGGGGGNEEDLGASEKRGE